MPDSIDATIVAPAASAAPSPLTTPEGREAHFQAALQAAGAAGADSAPQGAEQPAPVEPAGTKPAAEAPAAAEKPAGPDAVAGEDTPTEKGALGKARRLFREGDVDGALKLVLGVEAKELDEVKLTSKHFKALVAREKAAAKAVQDSRAEADTRESNVRDVATKLMPMVQAVQAYHKGDFEGFVKLATGDSLEGFQRKVIAQLQQTPAGKAEVPPELLARLTQLENERRAEKEESARMKAENERIKSEQAEAKWVGEIADELAKDERFVKVATKKAFLSKVLETQKRHFNPNTQMTVDALEAAEEVWEEFYGDVIDTAPRTAATAAKVASTGRGGSNGASGRKTTTNVNHSVPTEAAPVDEGPWSPDKQEKILKFWARKAQSEQHERVLNGA